MLGLLGPNGAGKTSLLRMLATVLPPSSGGIRLLGGDPKSAAQRREIRGRLGYLPQNLGYYPAFTVVEFVEYFALLKEVPPGRVNQAVTVAVERVDLGAKAKARLGTLSGGAGPGGDRAGDRERPGPAAARRADRRPRPGAASRVPRPLRDLGQAATVVVSTHLVEDVGAACSEVAVLDAGHVVFRGTSAELATRGTGYDVGDAPLERGYSAVLQAARSASRNNDGAAA